MDKDVGMRLLELRKSLGLTQGEFAEKIGLKFSAISMIELGKAPLKETNMRLICLTFGVNKDWLLNGIGEMMDDEALLSVKEKKLYDLFSKLSPSAQDYLLASAKGMIDQQEATKKQENPEN